MYCTTLTKDVIEHNMLYTTQTRIASTIASSSSSFSNKIDRPNHLAVPRPSCCTSSSHNGPLRDHAPPVPPGPVLGPLGVAVLRRPPPPARPRDRRGRPGRRGRLRGGSGSERAGSRRRAVSDGASTRKSALRLGRGIAACLHTAHARSQ